MVRALEAEPDRHLTGNEVDQRPGDKERRYAPRPPLLDQDSGVGNGTQPTDARPDHDARAFQGFAIGRRPAGILHRLLGGSHAVDDEVIDLALFLGLHPVVRIERSVRPIAPGHLAGIGCRQVAGVEALDRSGARLAGQQALPRGFNARCQGRDHSQPRHYHSPHAHTPFLCQVSGPGDSGCGKGRQPRGIVGRQASGKSLPFWPILRCPGGCDGRGWWYARRPGDCS